MDKTTKPKQPTAFHNLKSKYLNSKMRWHLLCERKKWLLSHVNLYSLFYTLLWASSIYPSLITGNVNFMAAYDCSYCVWTPSHWRKSRYCIWIWRIGFAEQIHRDSMTVLRGKVLIPLNNLLVSGFLHLLTMCEKHLDFCTFVYSLNHVTTTQNHLMKDLGGW